MKTINQAREYYESIESYDERRALQDEFGHDGEADRERKFYKWLRKRI